MGVESKKDMGALKIALLKAEKKAFEAFRPRWAEKTALRYTAKVLRDEIAA